MGRIQTYYITTNQSINHSGEIRGNLIEDIAEDVPSINPSVSLEDALKKAVKNEGDGTVDDVVFDKDQDAILAIYLEVVFFTARVRAYVRTTGGYVFTGVCLLRGGGGGFPIQPSALDRSQSSLGSGGVPIQPWTGGGPNPAGRSFRSSSGEGLRYS